MRAEMSAQRADPLVLDHNCPRLGHNYAWVDDEPFPITVAMTLRAPEPTDSTMFGNERHVAVFLARLNRYGGQSQRRE
jgi:hypothetical protein